MDQVGAGSAAECEVASDPLQVHLAHAGARRCVSHHQLLQDYPFQHAASHLARKASLSSFLFSHNNEEAKALLSSFAGIHFHAPVDSAEASSTYTDDGDIPVAFQPKMALRAGTGYWCSAGHHKPEDIVTWTGKLRKRRPVSGLKVSWAYAPGEVRVRATSDGLRWHDVVSWHKPAQNGVSFEEDMLFDRQRNVMELKVDMRHPREWRYFGLNQATLVM